MATHTLKPKDVERTLDLKFLLKKKREVKNVEGSEHKSTLRNNTKTPEKNKD